MPDVRMQCVSGVRSKLDCMSGVRTNLECVFDVRSITCSVCLMPECSVCPVSEVSWIVFLVSELTGVHV